jgi:two-component system alkaline phosphatase synthesis response regulator PhoP
MTGETVLLVEDTELIRRIYHDKLTEEGYRVLTAGDGLEALNTLRADKIDLVLLDLVMPRMSGLEALEAMRSDPRMQDIPVIILSNLGQDHDVRMGLEMGAVDYLVKNSAKPADVSKKIRLTLDYMADRAGDQKGLWIHIRDEEGDADALVERGGLERRFWCPACEIELVLELVPKAGEPGWYDAHLMCTSCGRDF